MKFKNLISNKKLKIDGPLEIIPSIFRDKRGLFFVVYQIFLKQKQLMNLYLTRLCDKGYLNIFSKNFYIKFISYYT